MKKTLTFLAMMLAFGFTFAQQKTNLIFFTEGGEQFYVVLNGVLQNQKPETNVKVTDLVAPNYKLKILFSDNSIPALEKNLMFNQGTETTFNIKKNNKGEWVVRYLSEVPIAQAPPTPSNQDVVVLSNTGPSVPATTTTTISTTTTTVPVTTSTTTTNPNNGSVSMGVNVNGVNMNMNINPGVPVTDASTTTTYSTTTTTTSSSTNSNVGVQPNNNVQPQQQQQPTYYMPGYNGPIGCPYPMSKEDFGSLKNSISKQSFEDTKLTISKQGVGSSCLLTYQVKEIMQLFSFEDSKLTFAKYAYGYTYDIGNYFKVNDAFTFSSSIDDLNNYISSYHK